MPDSRVSEAVTPSLGDALGVDEVDRHAGAVGQHAAEDPRGEQAGVEVGHAAAVGDLDGVDGRAGELHEQPAETRAEVHVGHELVGVVAGRRGHVDGAAQQPATEDGGDLLGHGDAGAAAGVERRRIGRAREQQVRRGETAADAAASASTVTAAAATGPGRARASAAWSTAPASRG